MRARLNRTSVRARARVFRGVSNGPSRAPPPMALSRPLFVGFSSASKAAREGGDLEVTVQTARGPRTFTLPWFFVRDVDALLERWRREEHEATLLTMNLGVLGDTLVEAAGAGGLRDTTFLLARGADVNAGWDDIALIASSRNGHLAVVAALLDAGAERRGRALIGAASRGRTPVVALLLDRGVDVHVENDAAVQSAAIGCHLETLQLLIQRGADVTAFGGNDFTPLENAAMNGHLAVATVLLDVGAGRMHNALADAAISGRAAMVALLLDRGVDVNALNDDHCTALQCAAEDGHLEIARLLLDRGADVNVDSPRGRPLQLARRHRHEAVVALLLERGAVEADEL